MATDLKDIPKFVQDVRRIFNSGKTKNMEWRRTQLKRLSAMISENINEWEAALVIIYPFLKKFNLLNSF